MNLSKADYDEVRDMLSAVLDDMPRLRCEYFHHEKKDQHKGSDCPVGNRFNRNMTKLCEAFGLEYEK